MHETRCRCHGCRTANLDERARALRRAVARRHPRLTPRGVAARRACERQITDLAERLGVCCGRGDE